MIEDTQRYRLMLIALSGAIVVSGVVDLYLDGPENWTTDGHVLFEVSLIGAALVLMVVLLRRWRQSAMEVRGLERALERQREQQAEWSGRADSELRQFGAAIDQQLIRWGLTPAEREVAIRLLKGSSHKAIARDTGRSAQTIRLHAASVYRKSGLAGRAELSGFFLDALPLPETTDGRSGPAES